MLYISTDFNWQLISAENKQWINSLTPGGCCCNLKLVILKLLSWIDVLRFSCKIPLRWMPKDLTGGYSTLVHVMAWCRQAPSHYLSQYWPRSLWPHGLTSAQWITSSDSKAGHSIITKACITIILFCLQWPSLLFVNMWLPWNIQLC